MLTAAGSAALLPTGVAQVAPKKSTEKPLGQGAWKLSLSEISTVNATFREDTRAYKAAGFDAIGIWEFKLPNDDSATDALHDAGLCVANCVPAVPSILPLRIPGMEGPSDLAERIAKISASMGRLARYQPASVLILTGPIGNLDPEDAHRKVVEGLREVAPAARAAGIRLGLEPINPLQRETVSFINSIADALKLLRDAGLDDVGILADTYNLWNESPADLAAIAHRVTGLHVADVPREAGRTDRVLPGEGGTRSAAFVSALSGAGWSGFLDVEIFSTPERFWGLPVDEAAKRAHAADAALRKRLA
jgi:sugar phosphate isomerase/epimerase